MEAFGGRPGEGGAGAFDDTPPQSPARPSASTSTPSASTSKPAPPPEEDTAMEEEPDEAALAKAEALNEKAAGNAAYKKRDLDVAEAHFAKAWDLYPSDITFLTNLAAVYFEKGDFPKTIETCQKAIDEGRSVSAESRAAITLP